MKKLCYFIFLFLTSCQAHKVESVVMPEITPKSAINIIGEIEPIYILPIKTPFDARIDTGAKTSSIDVTNLKTFERDGEKWASFVITNSQSGEKYHFEKEVVKQVEVKRVENNEKRIIINMEIKFGTEVFNANFSLNNREKFEYQALIGRNILSGRFAVDVSTSHSLY